MPTFTKEQIIEALKLLNEKLARREVMGELCIFGGAVMVLVFDSRQSTRDVDAIFVPRVELVAAAREVAEELALPEFWLNDGVKGYVSANSEMIPDDMPQMSHLRMLRPTAEYLLAMKCLAARAGESDHPGDAQDVTVLCRHLNLHDPEKVMALVSKFYPDKMVPAKTRYFIAEVLQDAGGNA